MDGMSVLSETWDWLRRNGAQVTALVALGLSVWQIRTTQHHNRVSVRPRITRFVDTAFDSLKKAGHIHVELQNSGLGPAFIRALDVYLDGQPFSVRTSDDHKKLVQAIIGQRPSNHRVADIFGHTMARDQKVDVLVIQFPVETDAEFQGLRANLQRLRLVIKYESLYGEKFVADSSKDRDL